MQLTNILATAITLCASGVFASTIDIAYTSNGAYYTQTVPSNSMTELGHPGNITTFQDTGNCFLYKYVGGETTYAPAGVHTFDPAVYTEYVLCETV
ncbi:uncharacterized protein BO80DRAFT_426318 [Aspergillus ibericus CBS 121593]|uniref:Uncharacterized protein n=1 Tax=Aspergillus ibericus CBS 121593 TaxID=1448316 RepID=A0A395GVN1_9EURO|nr:hypothetical protein BO80DRAFT_426318 [Aspergillus ibericus CBS 121593]RAK99631.1 hypothetical protein BO80DRAFT_426318 [Aspergillus ibericus CBS 121593]